MSIGRVPGVTGIQPSIVDAKGDLIVATAADSVDRLAVGANNLVLTADSATATGLKWAAPDPLTTKGDLFTFSTTEARLGVGANGTVLTADSAEATGLKWASVAGGGLKSFTLLNAGGTALTGSATITVSGISGQQAIFVVIEQASSASNSAWVTLRINSDTGSNYNMWGPQFAPAAITSGVEISQDKVWLGFNNSSADNTSGTVMISGTNSSSGRFAMQVSTMATGASSAGRGWGALYTASATLSSVTLFSTNGNFDGGTLYVFGMAA